ncbi:MAG: non-canonical purine NTP pyrophosphatase, RdgB/HAM1 family [Elusimicrobia bacterium RIFOXYA12_FULL_51_18]|nr:MAG: non-canonical purine NTP pyrophosphatase, RdgB/HAM1 family [Elusimicrobia bacterium RIFOXYA12_FULL_51_18]OGS31266.1 MAG: non-canonical purine NTP pyrophosphatase, RdgB/HAM1 family [Elusimicrobia bacterium RIFOXYA2_FULL_53_38]
MIQTVVLATRNKYKFNEILELLPGLKVEMKTLDNFPGAPEVVEDGATLEENASKKAKSAALFCGFWALADDTGLQVDALGGAPGVYSARYAGPGCSYSDNNLKLLAELAGLPPEKRTARFCCVMALSSPAGSVITVEGRLEGRMTCAPLGANGFGYDPLFLIPGVGKTLAELTPAEKNALSHRAAAVVKIEPYLKRLIGRAAS